MLQKMSYRKSEWGKLTVHIALTYEYAYVRPQKINHVYLQATLTLASVLLRGIKWCVSGIWCPVQHEWLLLFCLLLYKYQGFLKATMMQAFESVMALQNSLHSDGTE